MKRPIFYLSFLVLAAISIWTAVFSLPDKNLHLIACDVGQGDAILAVYKNIQVLTDGGPDNKVLDCLSRHIPFWDREIELVVLTHPQKDHYQGLIEVVRRYKVNNFLSNGLDASSQAYQLLKNEVGGRGIRVIHPERGMTIRLDMISLDIVHPSRAYMFSNSKETGGDPLGIFSTDKDPNGFSIVSILRLGEFDALLTGDLSPNVNDVLSLDPLIKPVEYLKVPHHGSKNGLTQALQEKIKPQVAVISCGRNNSYGHPNKETLELLKSTTTEILRTDLLGDVEIVTNGKNWWVKN